MDCKECIDFIKKNIPDEEVRRLIFSDDEEDSQFLTNKNLIPKYYNSIMVLANIYIYGRFRKWDEAGCENGENNNFKRVVGTLRKVFDTYDLSNDLMENILLDMLIDQQLSGSLQKSLKIEGIKINKAFPKYSERAKKYRRTSRIIEEMNTSDQRDELVKFIQQFPFLRYIKLILNKNENAWKGTGSNNQKKFEKLSDVILKYDDDFSFEEKEDKEIPTYKTLVRVGKEYYFLEHIELFYDRGENEGAPYSLQMSYYSTTDSSRAITIIVENEEVVQDDETIVIKGEVSLQNYIIEIGLGNVSQKGDHRDMYAVNYKYLKNLSLSISDVLSDSGRENLIEKYLSSFPDIFIPITGDGKESDENNYNWDNVIGMLLVRESASNVLNNIFYNDPGSFKRLLGNLEIRLGSGRIDPDRVRENVLLKQKKVVKWEKVYINGESPDPALKEELLKERKINKSEIAAREVIMALIKASDDRELVEETCSYPIGMASRIRFLNDLKYSRVDIKTKKETMARVVKHTLRALLCFYEGFFPYAEIKLQFEDESYYKCLSQEQIEAYQQSAEKAFVDTVNSYIKKLVNLDIPELMNEVEKLCTSCYNKNGDQTKRGKLLKEMLGKNMILDINRIKFLKTCTESIDCEQDINNAIGQVMAIFRYLMSGNSKDSNWIDPIFPHIVTYEYDNRTRDGYNIRNFIMNVEHGQPKDIQILSEFFYKMSDRYFCLPNTLRSNESLWIEPILIKFVCFDELMAEEVN